jgi:hypothetical protein
VLTAVPLCLCVCLCASVPNVTFHPPFLAVWVQVQDEEGTAIGDAVLIKPVPEFVAELREEVQRKKAPRLDEFPADELRIFSHGAVEEEGKGWKATTEVSTIIGDGNYSTDKPLIAVAPRAADKSPGECSPSPPWSHYHRRQSRICHL